MLTDKIPSKEDIKNMTSDNTITEILKGETSAVEAYENLEDEFSSGVYGQRIKEMKSHHQDALNFWKKQAKREALNTEPGSGVWGTVVKTFVNVSKVIGEDTALKALKTGEEHGLKFYQGLLSDSDLSPLQKEQIRNKFIPEHQSHITTLSSLTKVS